ncbi:unnamed protein product [Ostreobium quekettii]|uniref:Uncharacterized protein n=1 Tax=Ostreobium quekettii TaxID=121088 RepID=A0A8S1JAI7_9CHLO|nr:unnamed protein product [Ostreobium quekettii]|eukprot:evm.model.scf_1008.1 EVM.evm.TU.scf_1008.1   scf_1008:5025-5891(+)
MEGALAAPPFSGLWFSSREEEARFSMAYAEERFRPIDRAYHRLAGFVLAVAVAWAQLREVGLSRSGAITCLVSIAAVAMHCLWIWLGVDRRHELRLPMLFAHRIFCTASVVAMVPVWHSEPITSAWSLLQWLMGATGAAGLAFFSFATPLLTVHHLMVQGSITLFAALYTSRQACTEEVLSAVAAPYVVAAWRWLCALCTGSASSTPMPNLEGACWRVAVMAQVAWGFCAPSYILWASEYRARLRHSPGGLPRLTWRDMAVHWMLMHTGMSCFWMLLHAGAGAWAPEG